MPCPDLIRALVPELVPLLTGYTSAAAAALVHLLDGWNRADAKNRPYAIMAIAAILETLGSTTSQPLAWFLVLNRLGVAGAQQLVTDLECYEIASAYSTRPASEATPARKTHPRGFWRQQLVQAAINAPRALGVFLCCGRVCVRVDGPNSHLGGDACDELGRVDVVTRE